MREVDVSKIRSIREARKLTLKQLGEKIGYSESMINYIESGKRKLPIYKLKAISEILDVPIEFFIKNEIESLEITISGKKYKLIEVLND